MRQRKQNPVDIAALSKKYKCDVKRIIRAWKNEKNDSELSQALGINVLKLTQIRQDIATAHTKERQRHQKKSSAAKTSLLFKPW
jgi:flagellar basal body-associated protein FliL